MKPAWRSAFSIENASGLSAMSPFGREKGVGEERLVKKGGTSRLRKWRTREEGVMSSELRTLRRGTKGRRREESGWALVIGETSLFRSLRSSESLDEPENWACSLFLILLNSEFTNKISFEKGKSLTLES